MLLLRLHERQGGLPLHRQIVDQIAFQIETGELAAGVRLPSTRTLAKELGLSRGPVVLAYEELCERGFCESRVGHGTRVCGPASERALGPRTEMPGMPDRRGPVGRRNLDLDPRAVSLLPSIADVDHLPITEMRRAFDRVLRTPDRLRPFSESAGDVDLREAICRNILRDRGVNAAPQEVMIVPGTQYASVLIALHLVGRARRIHFGLPGYLDLVRNFSRFGIEPVGHPVDGDGVLLDESRLGRGDVLYLMPEHHFPQCVTLSPPRRERIGVLAAERDLLIIEDDYDSEFYYDRRPEPALKSGPAASSVIYLGTFSKTLFNSLRLGYLIADPDMVRSFVATHWSLSRGTSGMVQRWVYELIQAGVLERHVQRMRTVYGRKRDQIADVLRTEFPEWSFHKPKGGLQFFVEVGSPQTVECFLDVCRQRALKVASPEQYGCLGEDAASGRGTFLVIGFGAAPLDQILGILREVKASFPVR